jgi:hypothetical protein
MTTESVIESERSLGSSSLSTGLVFLGAIGAILGARLHIVIIHSKSLIDLAAKGSIIIDASAKSVKILRGLRA